MIFFKQKCETSLAILDDFVSLIENAGFKVAAPEIESEPSISAYIHFPDFEKGEMKVSYRTTIEISKIIPIYYVSHYFAVKNIDENRMCPELDGDSGMPYTFSQAETYDEISKFLNENGYSETTYAEMSTVVPDIEMPDDVWIFGPQFTVETCLFRDVLNICEVDE